MKTAVINYTGTGALRQFAAPFQPSFIVVVPLAVAQQPSIHTDRSWLDRTIPIGPAESITYGCRVVDGKLFVGPDASVNASGVSYRAVLCLAEDADILPASWQGNATNGRVVDLDTSYSR